ncbi:MAG TPA: GNAT family N-acetyltransferase [Gaiellales bacterium]|nr:GNAT family N-acetyltransferase [Gaiellales bacterium]
MRIERAASADAVAAVQPLFDHELRPEAVERFLADPTHHLLVGYSGEAGAAAGFVSGVETTHPDKGTEMFLYELAVEEASRNQGIGRALVRALADLARERGCYGMWVLTDDDNPAALRAYAAAGGKREPVAVMFSWTF